MDPTTRAELEALEALQDNVEPLADFIGRLTPRHARVPWHLQQVIDVIEETRRGEVYATISMPPRHGKTETLAHGLAWRALYDPACLNFYATFGEQLSFHTSRKVRKLARAALVPLSAEAQAVQDWRTVLDGGLKASSVGGDITGRGCNGGIIVCDDIIKGRKKAESKAIRDDAWDWFSDDVMSRLEPGASLIVNMTRWHEDDIIGRLHNNPLGLKWRHVSLPAVRLPDGTPGDEREDARVLPLWPENGYDLERYAKIRLRGEHGWWSLYQQTPFPRGGGMFRREWFTVVDAAPSGGTVVRGWDFAGSKNRDSAWTVGVKLRLVEGRVFVEHVARIQGSPLEVQQLVVNTAHQDGYGVVQDMPKDPGQAGLFQTAVFAQKLHGYTVRASREDGDKETRAEPFAAQAQAGNVALVRGGWNADYLGELESFPAGRTRDQVDASSRGYASLVMYQGDTDDLARPIVITA